MLTTCKSTKNTLKATTNWNSEIFFSNEAGFVFTGCSVFYLEEKLQNKRPHITKIAIYNTQTSKWTLDIFSV